MPNVGCVHCSGLLAQASFSAAQAVVELSGNLITRRSLDNRKLRRTLSDDWGTEPAARDPLDRHIDASRPAIARRPGKTLSMIDIGLRIGLSGEQRRCTK